VVFQSWSEIGRVLGIGAASYVALVLILRWSGKRTLAKLNAFDLIVTVALGSTLATSLLSSDVALTEAVTAMVLLVGAQFLVAWASVHSDRFRQAVRSQPAMLVHDGRLLHEELRRNRVSEGEVRQAIRGAGKGGLDMVAAVVLETDGTLSVVTHSQLGSGNVLDDVSPPVDEQSGGSVPHG
jgi:uncharacterized membrane protein YcaP (DUF421 family)